MEHPPVEKTIPVDQIVKNEDNPNKMSEKAFNNLVDRIQRFGLIENIVVRPTEDGKYRIVSGHHRFDACVYIGYTEIRCMVIMHPDFDQEEEDMLLVSMNMIKGKLDPNSFFKMYQKYASKYGDAVLKDSFGFADEAEWQRLVHQMSKQLPDKETQDKFKEAAQEIKTIDGLAELLNKMFTLYGDTLPYGYMVIDYGSQKSIWLRASSKTFKTVQKLGHLCIEEDVSLDAVFAQLFAHLMTTEGSELFKEIVEDCPKMDIPAGLVGVPTEQKLNDLQDS